MPQVTCIIHIVSNGNIVEAKHYNFDDLHYLPSWLKRKGYNNPTHTVEIRFIR